MKVTSTSRLKSDQFTVMFNDGILMTLQEIKGDLVLLTQCSLGIDSYYIKNNLRFPKGKNLTNRVRLGSEIINKRRKRYKKHNHEKEEQLSDQL
jgi:hypothetical protein